MDALVPLIVAVTGLPALGIAAWHARAGDAHGRGTALRWALIALAILCGAAGLYFTGDRPPGVWLVAVAMVVAVNALAVSMVLHLRRGGGRR
jgi:Na+/melibiose symporter-like transporter